MRSVNSQRGLANAGEGSNPLPPVPRLAEGRVLAIHPEGSSRYVRVAGDASLLIVYGSLRADPKYEERHINHISDVSTVHGRAQQYQYFWLGRIQRCPYYRIYVSTSHSLLANLTSFFRVAEDCSLFQNVFVALDDQATMDLVQEVILLQGLSRVPRLAMWDGILRRALQSTANHGSADYRSSPVLVTQTDRMGSMPLMTVAVTRACQIVWLGQQ